MMKMRYTTIIDKMEGRLLMQRKKKTRFQKITMVAIWLMLIAMLGSLIFGAVASLNLI